MANRFLETNYFKSPFVRGLKGPLKSLYSFIICDCTPSGIWSLDLEAASLYIGFTISEEEFDTHFVETEKAINIGGGRYFFPDFIEHQYPQGLIDGNRAHKNIICELRKLNFLDEKNQLIREKKKAPSKPLQRSTGHGLGLGNGHGLGECIYDAEKEVLENRIEFERICIGTQKNAETAKSSLRNYHLYLTEKEQYPKSKKAIFAGFEKWLRNEKNFTNGSQTHSGNSTPSGGQKLGTSDARINTAKNW